MNASTWPAGRWLTERLDDGGLLLLALVAIPLVILLVGAPLVLLAWLVSGVPRLF